MNPTNRRALIAAAPELYAALNALTADYCALARDCDGLRCERGQTSFLPRSGDPSDMLIVATARAALTKAEGRDI